MTIVETIGFDSARQKSNYGCVVLIAYVLLIAGAFALITNHSAGPGYGFAGNAATRAIFWGTIAPHFGPALLLWLFIVWSIFRRNGSWRGRNWIAVAPPLVFLAFRVGVLLADPPSPQRYFRETFAAELPADARMIQVGHPTLGDPGFVDFAFVCSKQSTLTLIDAMNLDRMTTKATTPGGYFQAAVEWQYWEWKTPHQYGKVQRTGTGHILIADTEMERVIVARNPLFAKSEAEYPQGKYKD